LHFFGQLLIKSYDARKHEHKKILTNINQTLYLCNIQNFKYILILYIYAQSQYTKKISRYFPDDVMWLVEDLRC